MQLLLREAHTPPPYPGGNLALPLVWWTKLSRLSGCGVVLVVMVALSAVKALQAGLTSGVMLGKPPDPALCLVDRVVPAFPVPAPPVHGCASWPHECLTLAHVGALGGGGGGAPDAAFGLVDQMLQPLQRAAVPIALPVLRLEVALHRFHLRHTARG